jgi:hypothetical protein
MSATITPSRDVYRAEPEVAALAVYAEAHGSALAAAFVDLEIEATAIRVPAPRRDVVDRGGRETMDASRVVAWP